MVKISPFKGIHYNFKKIPDLSRVVVPPYDIISEKGRDYFFEMHPYNFVRLIRGERRLGDSPLENPYTRAQQYFRIWLKDEIFLQDTSSCLYFYRQEFVLNRQRLVRNGLIASVKLTEEKIFPHESIMPEPVEDRFQLLKTCRTNFSPIFTAYSDPTLGVSVLCEKISSRPPFVDAMDNLKVRHLLWRVNDAETIEAICQHLQPMNLYIVDGHHRFAAALKYRDRMREEGGAVAEASEAMMMYLCPLEDSGLKVFPIHRGISGLADFSDKKFFERLAQYFQIRSMIDSKDFFVELEKIGRGAPAFGFKLMGDLKFYIATLKDLHMLEKFTAGHAPCYARSCSVVLHQIVLKSMLGISEEEARAEKGVTYIKGLDKDVKAALLRVAKGTLQGLFFLPRPEVTDIVEFARSGETMPQKSTYFYPKVIGGLILRDLD